MSTVTEEQSRTPALLEDLRTFASQKEAQIKRLETSLADAVRRIKNLTAERGSLLLPARSENNAKAQKRLLDIDGQLAALRRDSSDDMEVLAGLQAQLVSAKNNVYRAEWELRRAGLREMIENRLSGKTAKVIDKAVEALHSAIQTAQEEDDAIRVSMLQFEPGLARDLKPLQMAGFERSRVASWQLKNVLLVDGREFGNEYSKEALKKMTCEGRDRRFYGDLLETVDHLELVF